MISGYNVFGKAYGVMNRNDLHHMDSIDHKFLKEMILLDEESYNFLYNSKVFISKDVSSHELYIFAQQFKDKGEKQTIINVLRFTSAIALSYNEHIENMCFGGREKDILARGTDWCADMSRVGCVLLQCLGIPARIVHLVDLNKAYNGHVVCEAFYEGSYGICDFIYGVLCYEERPLSAFYLQNNKGLISKCYKKYYDEYTPEMNIEGMFSGVAINEYNITSRENKYIESKVNDYYLRLINEQHNNTWIMNEDS